MCQTTVLKLSIFFLLFREMLIAVHESGIKIMVIKHVRCRTRFVTRSTVTPDVLPAVSGMTQNPSESTCEVTSILLI
jgi:hypothetical protein